MSDDPRRPPAAISAVILTCDEELNLPACLESLAGWCGQVVIVDSGSRDQTVEIARRYGATVIHHEYVDHSRQWEWILDELPLAYEWILPLDADHIVSTPLRDQLIDASASASHSAYYARHRYVFKGATIRGFKSSTLRLFRRTAVRVDTSELVEWRFIVKGSIGYLPGVLWERNRKEDAIDFWIEKHRRFAGRIAAEETLRRLNLLERTLQPSVWGTPDQRRVWLKDRWLKMPLFLRPCIYFLYRFVFCLGCLDGTTGAVYHVLQAFWFRLVIDIKIVELRAAIDAGRLSARDLQVQAGVPLPLETA